MTYSTERREAIRRGLWGGASREERFLSLIDRSPGSTDCWPWRGQLGGGGYGRVHWLGHSLRAHRKAYELLVGPIPSGLHVCHSCDNPPCCNPAHLWLGTDADNLADMRAKGRRRYPLKDPCLHGHPYDEANTMHPPSGGRGCKACSRERCHQRRAHRRAA